LIRGSSFVDGEEYDPRNHTKQHEKPGTKRKRFLSDAVDNR